MTSIHEILKELRLAALDERDKGSLFEKLTKTWLEVSPEYSNVFDKVWLYADWAAENGIPKTDVGIDLVARDVETQEFCGIQCKFYAENHTIQKKDIDSFFTALSRKHFSFGMIISTSKNWSSLAEAALEELTKPVVRIGLHDLENSGVDWSKFSLKNVEKLEVVQKKVPYEHQRAAISDALNHFSKNDRGKLIMACGTGKTFTSLRLAEQMVPEDGTMLFLVPSIALLSQSLKEWKQEADHGITAYAVCSDVKVGKSKSDEDIQVTDLAYPATTDAKKLAKHFEKRSGKTKGMTVVFSTYQSIDVISKAQALGLPEFDLIICDEAHRTTGVTLAGADESAFVKVHDNSFIQAKKRMYMTATPRIYGDQSKAKAAEVGAELTSMDNPAYFGEEFHRLNFGKAVSAGLLSDYKVLVLAVSEEHVSRQLQKLLTRDGELDLDDATKIVGCYNGLRKRSNNADDFIVDTQPMKSAVAFSRSIKDSKRLAELFQVVTEELNKENKEKGAIKAEADHVDGTYNMEARLTKLDWLKEETENTVRILSNARCLSEGVDVPALDAVLFLNPRDSQVDVVQSVGRVMRRSPGKEYGYVILPITVPLGKTAEEALEDNNRYKVVWQVLQALRSHDERFNAMINKIDLTGDTDDRFKIIGVGGSGEGEPSDGTTKKSEDTSFTLDFPIEDWKDAILAKIVQKVGQKTYWENWASDVAGIAQDHIGRIGHLLDNSDSSLQREFDKFLKGLKDNLNPQLDRDQAIEMLAQHLITKPVFDSLFENYSFTDENPVSKVMQQMLEALSRASFNDESHRLEEFYESVRIRASGISDASGRQKVIKDLYEKFFKIAFARDSERLGIVYTPNEIVDFMLRMTDNALQRHFDRSIGDERVSILDPFTGTGTFIVRLIQSSLVSDTDLQRKFRNELHANEIVLLAYYVAAINIEEAYHSRNERHYEQFNGVVLTDTFQMYENDDLDEMPGFEVFEENNSRVLNQKNQNITVVIGNPPYSAGQLSSNDNNANAKYPTLDDRISETFGALSTTRAKNTLYDSYIRAIRWALDRVGNGGIVAFVTNNGYLDSSTAEGVRRGLVEESSHLYVVNLRGNSRTLEMAKREGGNVFDVRVGISILFVVKSDVSEKSGQIKYFEFEDFATKAEKLSALENWHKLDDLPWTLITPNSQGDWLNQRTQTWQDSIPLIDSTKKGGEPKAIFRISSSGAITHRDAWVFNFSRAELEANVRRMITFYNSEVERLRNKSERRSEAITDPKKISWSHNLWKSLDALKLGEFDSSAIRVATYRPFVRCYYYADKFLSHSLYQLNAIFPNGYENHAILTTGIGMKGKFKAMAVAQLPESQTLFNDILYPRWFVPKNTPSEISLFSSPTDKVSAISEYARRRFSEHYGRAVDDDSIYFYVFGLLSHPAFIEIQGSNLTKDVPSVPLLENFDSISALGKSLFEAQVDINRFNPYPAKLTWSSKPSGDSDFEPGRVIIKTEGDKLSVIYNSKLTIEDIPESAISIKFGTRSALEWIVDRWPSSKDKNSEIENRAVDFFDSAEQCLEYLLKSISAGQEFRKLTDQLTEIRLT